MDPVFADYKDIITLLICQPEIYSEYFKKVFIKTMEKVGRFVI